jgi:hypothetical protein
MLPDSYAMHAFPSLLTLYTVVVTNINALCNVKLSKLSLLTTQWSLSFTKGLWLLVVQSQNCVTSAPTLTQIPRTTVQDSNISSTRHYGFSNLTTRLPVKLSLSKHRLSAYIVCYLSVFKVNTHVSSLISDKTKWGTPLG